MSVVIPMAQGKDELLAERYRVAVAKQDGGREQWIEGTLERAEVMLELRTTYPDHRAFSLWLSRHRFSEINKNDRTALLWMAANPEAARSLMEKSDSISPTVMYRNMPEKMRKDTLPKNVKGVNCSSSRPSGALQRKRAMTIPTVMRDDYKPGSSPRPDEQKRKYHKWSDKTTERPLPILKGLTPEQVDPDFTGNRGEFIQKYGLVNLYTKEQLEARQLEDELTAWLGLVSDCAKTAKTLSAATVDPATLQQWLLKPGKSVKLHGWFAEIEQAYEKMLKIQDEFKRG
jgi:hypothetical protein